MRSQLLISMAALAALSLAGSCAAEGPLQVGARKQLFFDRRFIAASENVALRVNPAQKLGPVFKTEKTPWEFHPGQVAAVFEDGGVFKMYYGAYTPVGRAVAYAESKDGVHWNRPALGLVNVEGNTNNNLIVTDQGSMTPEVASVFLDPKAPADRRYVLFMGKWKEPHDPNENGVYAYTSADGKRFEKRLRVLPLLIDNPVLPAWDERIGKYVIWTRTLARDSDNQRRVGRIETAELLAPWPYNTSAPDFKGRASTEHLTNVLAADDKAEPFTDLYYNNALIYPFAQDAYLMFVTPFRHFSPGRQKFFRFQPGNDYGFIESQLAISRDGVHWSRPGYDAYIPMGFADEWDRWLIVMGNGMVRKGNYLYQYYTSSGRTHDSGILRPEHDKLIEPGGGIGVVRQRLDGFVSVDAGQEGGWIETPPLVFQGRRLRLNIDTGGTGVAFVEIRDAEGKPIPGFTAADAEEVGGNYIDQTVYWNGATDVSSLVGKPIRLRLSLKRAKLYAFQFTD